MEEKHTRTDYEALLRLPASAIVTQAEVAILLRHSPRSMCRIVRKPGFPIPLPKGGHKRWRKGDIDAWSAGAYEAPTTHAAVAAPGPHAVPSRQRATDTQQPDGMTAPFLFSTVEGAADAAAPFTVTSVPWLQFTAELASPLVRRDVDRDQYLALAKSNDAWNRKKAKSMKDGLAWIPAIFGHRVNDSGNLRWAGNVGSASALVLDIDNSDPKHPILALDEALAAIPSEVNVAWHTTFSHVPERPRFRVIVPWITAIFPDVHEHCFDAIQRRLGNRLDTVSRSAATLYYLPSCPKDAIGDYRFGTRGSRLAQPRDLQVHWSGTP